MGDRAVGSEALLCSGRSREARSQFESASGLALDPLYGHTADKAALVSGVPMGRLGLVYRIQHGSGASSGIRVSQGTPPLETNPSTFDVH
ncbi:MAG: hypothetical protein JWN85_2104 [Gammaproteobacteria bacterium]|nr:hypothetical protein [Gammaproteobacteria bacterium]